MKKVATPVCYLCGKPLAPPINADHPVMQQIFAPEIRRKYNVSKLISDEDYFVRTLMPFARGSEAGNSMYKKVLDDFRSGKQVPLTKMVLQEFHPKPSGLVLPSSKVVKKFDGERIRRVAWKMVRGLHFYHHSGQVLPERWPTVGVQGYAGETPPRQDR